MAGKELRYSPDATIEMHQGETMVIKLPWIHAAPAGWVDSDASFTVSAAHIAGTQQQQDVTGRAGDFSLAAITAVRTGLPAPAAAVLEKGSLLFPL